MENERIAALATPMAGSAIAVIRTSGEGCIEAIAACTDRPDTISNTPGGRIKRVNFIDPHRHEIIDDVLLAIFRGPASYTGDDSVEINCHGSVPGVQRILDTLFQNGFRSAEPGEFTQRAFLAGKIDLTRAEAVQEIVGSQTFVGHELALQRLAGSVEAAVRGVKDELVQIMAQVAVQIDYPEDETGEIPIDPSAIHRARKRLRELADTYQTGRLYQEGVTIAIAGKTNAGKSSLFNALLREDRAIVSETHGTTRDYISSRIDLQGIPAELYDTAGLRETREAIEEEGIRRTKTLVSGTDLVLYVVDGTVGFTDEDRRALADIPQPTIVVWNKVDVDPVQPIPVELSRLGTAVSAVSASEMTGIEKLVATVVETIVPDHPAKSGAAVIDSLRQKNLLEQTITALDHVAQGIESGTAVDLISVDLQEALYSLGEIVGEVTSEEILDAVFSGFCLGK